jgi:hypothetical protein
MMHVTAGSRRCPATGQGMHADTFAHSSTPISTLLYIRPCFVPTLLIRVCRQNIKSNGHAEAAIHVYSLYLPPDESQPQQKGGFSGLIADASSINLSAQPSRQQRRPRFAAETGGFRGWASFVRICVSLRFETSSDICANVVAEAVAGGAFQRVLAIRTSDSSCMHEPSLTAGSKRMGHSHDVQAP